MIKSFKWWNSQIEGCYDLLNPPQLVPARVATSIFNKIFPFFWIFDEFNDNDQAYWGEIHRFLRCRFQNIEIPSPSLNFPHFIHIIFNLKDKIKPNNLNECFQFIQSYQTAQPAFFLLRQYPIIINDPILYFETIIYFSNYNKTLWQTIIKEYRFIDNFFYMNKNFFSHFPKDAKVENWSTILLCSSAFSKVLSASLEYHTHTFEHSKLYIKEIIKFFEFVPDYICTSLLRDILIVIKSCHQKIQLRDKLTQKIIDILHSLLSKDPINLKYAIQFSLSLEPSIISNSTIVSTLTRKAISNICDIEILELVFDSTTAYDILVYLSKIMIQDKIYHRSCSSFILQILKKYDKNALIREYAINFVNGLFIFISHAKKTRKYKFRSLLICETLAMFMESDIFWLQRSIINAASTIAQVGYFPCYFDLLFPITLPKDPSLVDLLSSTISKAKKPKYKFFPFIKTKNEYALLNSSAPKDDQSIKKINECVTALKSLKTKTKLLSLVHSLASELRNLLFLQVKCKHLFPRDFDTLLLSLLKLRFQANVINIYQLMRNILFFMDDSNISRVIDALNFGIVTKSFISIYEFAIVLKKYGIIYANLASIAIDGLIGTELNTAWAIQTYRRLIKNAKLQNELVSAIILSSISSDDEFVKLEGIKTIPYILNDDVDEIVIYQNLKNDLISSNNNVLFIASKSLATVAYKDSSIAQNLFTKLIKKQERLNAFQIAFPLYLKHFNIPIVLQILNVWSLFLLNLNDSFSTQHISSISKIVINSFVSILGVKCSIIKSLLNNVTKDALSCNQTVVILNAFALSLYSSKFVISNQEIFFNALISKNKEMKNLAVQCFEQFAKNYQSLGLSFLQNIIDKNDNSKIGYFQAEALILKHISNFIDEKALTMIHSNKSLFNILTLSFLSAEQLPKNIFDYEDDENIIKKLLIEIESSKRNDEEKKSILNKYKNYLSFFLFKHHMKMPEKLALLILKTLINQFEFLPQVSLYFIYKVASSCHDQEISTILAEQSLNLLLRISNSKSFCLNSHHDEIDRKHLFSIHPISFSDKFSTLLIEKDASHKLYDQIISSLKSLLLNTPTNDKESIISRLFASLVQAPENVCLNNDSSILACLSLTEKVICNKLKSNLPSDGLSVLLSLKRNHENVEKISSCVSKWTSVFPDSLDDCFNSFIYSDAVMFSFFLKNHSRQLTEYAAETFYVQLKIHIDRNPLILLKAIPSFMKNKFITKEMKNSLFQILEELISYDILVRPETIKDYFEAICSLESLKFSKIIMSLLNFPLNSSIATFYGIKLMKKIKNKALFYDILDEIIDKYNILNKDINQNAMNNEILFKALKIRNTIENVPLMLLLYQQKNDARIVKLVNKTFELDSEALKWTILCKLVLINKILPTKKIQFEKVSEEQKNQEEIANENEMDEIYIKPSFLVKKLMFSIVKKLVSKIKNTYPFQLEYIESILDIVLKCFTKIKLQKKASSVLSVIIDEIGAIDSNDFIVNHFSSMQDKIEMAFSNTSMFLKLNKFVFSLLNFSEKVHNQQIILDLVNNLKMIVPLFEKENILMFLRISSRLYRFSNNFELSPSFEMKAREFIASVFDKKCHLSDLKMQLANFVEVLIHRYPTIIPNRILRFLIIEEILHKSKDSLLHALAILINNVNCVSSSMKMKSNIQKTKESQSNVKPNENNNKQKEANSNSNDSNKAYISNNDPNETNKSNNEQSEVKLINNNFNKNNDKQNDNNMNNDEQNENKPNSNESNIGNDKQNEIKGDDDKQNKNDINNNNPNENNISNNNQSEVNLITDDSNTNNDMQNEIKGNDSEQSKSNCNKNDSNESNNKQNEIKENDDKQNENNSNNNDKQNEIKGDDNKQNKNDINNNNPNENNKSNNNQSEVNLIANDSNTNNDMQNEIKGNDSEQSKNNCNKNDSNESNNKQNENNILNENDVKLNDNRADLKNSSSNASKPSTSKATSVVSKNVNSIQNTSPEITIDEVNLILSKIQSNNFEKRYGYHRLMTSLAMIIPHSIGIKWKTVLKIILSSSFSTPVCINFECLAILFQKVHFKIITDFGPAVFRTIILSKDIEKVVALSSIIFDKLPPQINELLLAELVFLRPFDLPLVSRILSIGFESLSGYIVSNLNIIHFLKSNVFDFSLSFVGNLLYYKKTEKQGVVLLVQLFESIANECLSISDYSNSDFKQVVIKMICLFELFLIKAKSIVKKKDFKKFQIEIARLLLHLLPHIDSSSKPPVYYFMKSIPKDILLQSWSKINTDKSDFMFLNNVNID